MSQCAALGAHLAVPRSAEQRQCAVVAAGGVQVWLGITSLEKMGEYVGADGLGPLAAADLPWADGQPNDIAGQRLMALTPPGVTNWQEGWHDIADWFNARPLCQWTVC